MEQKSLDELLGWTGSRRRIGILAEGWRLLGSRQGKIPENVGYPRFRADLRLIYYGPVFRPNTVGQPTNFWAGKMGPYIYHVMLGKIEHK